MSNYLTDHRIIAVSRPDKRINLFIQGGTSSSFVLPKDITAIEEYAFHNISGLTEVVFTNQDVVVEVDGNSGIPANAKFIVPAKFLPAYQAKYPNRTVETRGVIWTVPFIGDTTLTKAYINQCILQEPEVVNAEVVIIPVEFTEYESGSINAIISAFSDMEMLTTCYEAGNIDLDMNGDIVAKIVEIGKTVDEALVYAKTLSKQSSFTKPDLQAIIVPPLGEIDGFYNPSWFENNTNLVYVAGITFVGNYGQAYSREMFKGCTNLVKVEKLIWNVYPSWGSTENVFVGNTSLKYADIPCPLGYSTFLNDYSGAQLCANLEHLIVDGLIRTISLSSTKFTRQALVDLFNSLGTPETTKTLTIGATNLSKLTEADKKIAYDKNWQLA